MKLPNDKEHTAIGSNLHFVLASAFTLIFGVSLLLKPYISPEIAISFVLIKPIGSFTEAFSKIFVFSETWYRPLTIYISNFFIWNILEVDQIPVFKLLGFCNVVICASLIAKFSGVLFTNSSFEKALCFCLALSHPSYFWALNEGTGLSDPFFNIFILATLLVLVRAFPISSDLNDLDNSKDTTSRLPIYLSLFFALLSILSHERGIAVVPMVYCVYLFHKIAVCTSTPSCFRMRNWGRSEATVIAYTTLAALYFFVVFSAKPTMTGEHYRTVIDPYYILQNLLPAIEIPFRFNFSITQNYYAVHRNIHFNLVGTVLMIFIAVHVLSAIKSRDKTELRTLLFLTSLFLTALVIPTLFSNGKPWHFYTAQIFATIITARSMAQIVCKLVRYQELKTTILILFLVFLCSFSLYAKQQETPPGSNASKFLMMIQTALNDKTLNRHLDEIPDVVFYGTGAWGEFTWPFGGQGHLFRFLYKKTEIQEIAIMDGKVISSDLEKCEKVRPKSKILAVEFDPEKMKWSPMENKNYCLAP